MLQSAKSMPSGESKRPRLPEFAQETQLCNASSGFDSGWTMVATVKKNSPCQKLKLWPAQKNHHVHLSTRSLALTGFKGDCNSRGVFKFACARVRFSGGGVTCLNAQAFNTCCCRQKGSVCYPLLLATQLYFSSVSWGRKRKSALEPCIGNINPCLLFHCRVSFSFAAHAWQTFHIHDMSLHSYDIHMHS